MGRAGTNAGVRHARADGVRIAYDSMGAGPPLVLCHAFAVDRTMWDLHRARFAEHHRLLRFDQRGSGESDHPNDAPRDDDPYTLDGFADDLRAVLDDAGVERASVLGFSMGAATALRFAIRWPERVDRLVLASAMASRLPQAIIDRARKVERVLDEDGLEAAYQFYFGGALFEGIPDSGKLGPELSGALGRATPHGFRGCYRVTIDRPSMAGELNRITAPTLVLVGEYDVHYLEEAELMAERIVEAERVVVSGVGHAMSVEAPERFGDEVLRFLGAPDLPRP